MRQVDVLHNDAMTAGSTNLGVVDVSEYDSIVVHVRVTGKATNSNMEFRISEVHPTTGDVVLPYIAQAAIPSGDSSGTLRLAVETVLANEVRIGKTGASATSVVITLTGTKPPAVEFPVYVPQS